MSGIPNHISITPNGNRRKARQQQISYEESYTIGAMRALDVAGWAKDAGVRHITFFGLSCENVERRPPDQIDALQEGAILFCDMATESGVAVRPFGKIDEFADNPRYARLYAKLDELRRRPLVPEAFVIHVAANYSGRAVHELGALMDHLYSRGFEEVRPDPEKFLLSGGVPPVDLAIRTGGEHRISGLLPFQMAYAELFFTDVLWADFAKEEFDRAIDWFANQQRNFGK